MKISTIEYIDLKILRKQINRIRYWTPTQRSIYIENIINEINEKNKEMAQQVMSKTRALYLDNGFCRYASLDIADKKNENMGTIQCALTIYLEDILKKIF